MNIWEIDKVFLFLVLVLPGFISMKVYDLIIAGEKRDFSKSLIEAIAYSVLNFAALSWLIVYVSSSNLLESKQTLYWLSILLIFIIFPALWPFLFVRLSKIKLFKKHLLSPINQPWDQVFSKRRSYWIVAHLKNGKTIRGKYATNSYASAYPKERQIYLEELWREGNNGGFGRKISRTEGVLIFEKDIEYIEFFN